MLYIMRRSDWAYYEVDGQLKLLQEVKSAIVARYPKTDVRVDRLVVTIDYSDFHLEVQPVFELDDGTFTYPDTKSGGSWRITKPREELDAFTKMDAEKNSNLRRLSKMARAWRNKHGVGIGGLLVDTLAYNFLASTAEFDKRSFLYYDRMTRDSFKYLSALPAQDRYNAPSSSQHVKVKNQLQGKAAKAYRLSLRAIGAEGTDRVRRRWKKVFGRPFPDQPALANASRTSAIVIAPKCGEEFVEDYYPVDIRYSVKIACNVSQNGFREYKLTNMILRHIPLLAHKAREFEIDKTDVPGKYDMFWKGLNRGEDAVRRNMVRGQIIKDQGKGTLIEKTTFRGDHVVECYVLQNGIVVAKDRIHVPISTNAYLSQNVVTQPKVEAR